MMSNLKFSLVIEQEDENLTVIVIASVHSSDIEKIKEAIFEFEYELGEKQSDRCHD
jgi:hypothetical protein